MLSNDEMNGYANKQHAVRYSAGTLRSKIIEFETNNNPHEIKDPSLHSEKVTVLCGSWAVFIDQYFFENDIVQVITFNGEHYGSIIINFF